KMLDFAEIAQSGRQLSERGHQKSLAFLANQITVLCSQPEGEGGRAWRYLQKHPDGIGTLIFEVENIAKTFSLLERRGGTIINDIETVKEDGGVWKSFSITTPLGDTTFRFVERENFRKILPGMEYHAKPHGGDNRLGFVAYDHVTSNFQT